MLLNLLFALSAVAIEPQSFISDYTLVSGSEECSESITIDERDDWREEGRTFIGVNENVVGRGLKCSFYKINEGAFTKNDDCPTAGPVRHGCVQVEYEKATLEGNKLTSKHVVRLFNWGVLIQKDTTDCSLEFRGDELVYYRKKAYLRVGRFPESDRATCVYR